MQRSALLRLARGVLLTVLMFAAAGGSGGCIVAVIGLIAVMRSDDAERTETPLAEDGVADAMGAFPRGDRDVGATPCAQSHFLMASETAFGAWPRGQNGFVW